MSAQLVTITEIAVVAGLTYKHVRRMAYRATQGRSWCGADMRLITPAKGEWSVEFVTLPEHIREAFVMLDQNELPFAGDHLSTN